MEEKRIAIRAIVPPQESDIEEDLEWLCRSLDLSTTKDTENSAYRVFKALFTSSISGRPKTISEISRDLNLTRGAVLFHIRKFYNCGLVERAPGGRYKLRGMSLEETIDEIMRDAEKMMERIKKIAADIDQAMGFKKRW